jgi:hypothetical protein
MSCRRPGRFRGSATSQIDYRQVTHAIIDKNDSPRLVLLAQLKGEAQLDADSSVKHTGTTPTAGAGKVEIFSKVGR